MLEFILVVLLLLGFGKYLGTEMAQIIIGIIGGIVLGYLGIRMLKDVYSNKITIELQDNGKSKQGNLLLGGALVSASNPYFIFWWAAVGLSLVMTSYNAFGFLGVIVFYIGHILTDISWYTFVALLVSKTRAFIHLKVYRVIIIVLAIFIIGFGVSFMINSVKTILLRAG